MKKTNGKGIRRRQTAWIQLFDAEGMVAKTYAANAIPRFVLIDKQGKIIDFDAPRPSSKKEIESILNREIAK